MASDVDARTITHARSVGTRRTTTGLIYVQRRIDQSVLTTVTSSRIEDNFGDSQRYRTSGDLART